MARHTPQGWRRVKVTATGTVGLGAGAIYGGIYMQTAGTTTTVTAFDAAANTAGTELHATTATLTAGQYVSPIGGVSPITVGHPVSDGIVLATNLHIVVGGTGSPVFWVLFK